MQTQTRLAVPDAFVDRTILRGRRLQRWQHPRLVGTTNPHLRAVTLPLMIELPRERESMGSGLERRRLLRPQLRRQTCRRRAAPVARGRPARPVRVQLTLARQEHAWEAQGQRQLIDSMARPECRGGRAAYDLARAIRRTPRDAGALADGGVSRRRPGDSRGQNRPANYRLTITTTCASFAHHYHGRRLVRASGIRWPFGTDRTPLRMESYIDRARDRPESTRSNTACAILKDQRAVISSMQWPRVRAGRAANPRRERRRCRARARLCLRALRHRSFQARPPRGRPGLRTLQ